MKGKKIYGQSKQNDCPFCGMMALSVNEQGVPTCLEHKERLLQNFKCVCGDWLDLLKGKWGPFFRCMNCGPVNFRKGMELNADKIQKSAPSTPKNGSTYPSENTYTPSSKKQTSSQSKEITVRSDELDFWFE